MWNNTPAGGRLGRPEPATGRVTEQVPNMWNNPADGGRLGRPGPVTGGVTEQVPTMWNNPADGGRLGRPGPATGGITEQVPKMWNNKAEGGRLGRPGPQPVRGGEFHIPVSSNTPRPEPSPFKRHNTARYYAHRVKESFTTQMTKAICAIFLGLLLIVGIISFILWLSLRPHRPRFHIESLSIPPTGLLNVPVTFNATARNPNMNIGIYYESMSVTCKYKDAIVGSDNMLVPFLYQQPKNTTMLFGVIHGESSMTVQWPAAMRLEFTSMIRFKISSWRSKNHTMHANCEVVLGQDGLLLPEFVGKRCGVYFT